MKTDKIHKLKPNDELIHRRYGVVKVIRLIPTQTGGIFGVTVEPVTQEGKDLLLHDSGGSIPQLLEADFRLLNSIPQYKILATNVGEVKKLADV